MTIIIPDKYHIKDALERQRIQCISDVAASRQDIRPLRIGVLNIMPKAEEYEYSLLIPLGRSIIQIDPIWIRLKSHGYKSSSAEHLEHFYVSFEDAIRNKHLDGLILTGAPVEEMPFEEVSYWKEVVKILDYAKENIASTMGICWGGLALAKYLGIEKMNYREKLFGVFKTKNLDRDNPITGDLDDYFWTPQSRHAGIDDKVLFQAQQEGKVNLLAYSEDTGYTVFESPDHKFISHLGHPEYRTNRLVDEYIRDRDKGRSDVVRPRNLDINRPINTWRSHSFEFFDRWIKYVYETTPF